MTAAGPGLQRELTGRLEAIWRRVSEAGGSPDRVTIVAVTKGFDAEAVAAVTSLGLADVGENYAGELLAKAQLLPEDQALHSPLRWHFLGAIQRNKVRALAGRVHLWQGLTRLVEGEEIARWAPGAGVLVQVEVTGIPGRRGCRPEEAPELVAALGRLGLNVRGLMAVGRPGPPRESRAGFRLLAGLGRDLELAELSMGMTEDLEVAVEEGSTMVRPGRALLGPRPVPPEMRGYCPREEG